MAPVTFDAASTSANTSGTGVTSFTTPANLTIGASADYLLYMAAFDANVTGITATWAGQTMSQVKDIFDSTSGRAIVMMALGNPSTGTHSATFSWSTAAQGCFYGNSWINVNEAVTQTSGSSVATNSTGATINLAVGGKPAGASDALVGWFVCPGTSFTATNGTTLPGSSGQQSDLFHIGNYSLGANTSLQASLPAATSRTWLALVINLNASATPAIDYGEWTYITPSYITPTEPTSYRTWEATFPKTLRGRDFIPSRNRLYYDLPPPEFREFRQWEYQYLKTLRGADKVPGKQISDLAQIPDVRDYRSWEWKYNASLIGKDKLPMLQHDWPVPYPVTWPQLGHMGRLYKFTTIVVNPFAQYDWPNPTPVNWYQWHSSDYNRYLLPGKDKLPVRQQDWPIPSEFREFRDWFQKGIIVYPFRQSDWPLSPEFREYRDWSQRHQFTPVVITVPFTQTDWANPQSIPWQQFGNLYRTLSAQGPVIIPFNQTDWPVPYPVNWDVFYSKSRQLTPTQPPFKQSDWPLPTPVDWRIGEEFFNPNYYTPTIYILMPQIWL